MDEEEFKELLEDVLNYEDEETGIESQVESIRSFEEAGLLTRDKGLVVTLKDGSEFQVAIVRSD